MSRKAKPKEHASVLSVRPTHEKLGGHTQGMAIGRAEIIKVSYTVDVLGGDMFTNREGAIEMYAQMAASRIREILSPIQVTG